MHLLKTVMHPSIKSDFPLYSKQWQPLLGRLVLCMFFVLIGQFTLAQNGNESDSVKSRIVLRDGAEIYSEDEMFNDQILSDKIVLENASILSVNKSESSSLIIVQSIASSKIVSKIIKSETKELQETSPQLPEIYKRIPNKAVLSENYSFENGSSPNNYTANKCIGRDCINLNSFEFKFLKISTSGSSSGIRKALNDLHCNSYVFYNSVTLNDCFSTVHSVRPPPTV